MKAKLFTLLFALAVGVGYVNAEIYSGTCGDNLTWELNSLDSTLVITGTGDMTDFPTYRSAPWYNYGVARVNLPNGITHIGNYAFVYGAIKSITIPTSVTTIGDAAFRQCKLEQVTIPDNVLSIGEYAFWECQNLVSVHLGNSLQTIGTQAFSRCYQLETINFPESITYVGDGILFNSGVQHPVYNSTVFAYLQPSYTGRYRIPNGIKLVSSSTSSPHLTSLFIPRSVEQMGTHMFTCDTLIIEDLEAWFNIDFIGDERANPLYEAKHFFLNDTELTSVVVPESITKIKNYALVQKSLSIRTVIINDSVTSIGTKAIYLSSQGGYLDTFIIGQNVDTIYNDGLRTAWKSIVWKPVQCHCPDCSSWAATYGPLSHNTNVMESFVFGDNVERIPAWLCSDVKQKEFILPASLKTIEKNVFYGCDSIRSVICKAVTPPVLDQGCGFAFSVNNNPVLTVPCGARPAYLQSDWAQYFAEIVEDQPFAVEVDSEHPEMGTAEVLTINCENQTTHILATPAVGYKFTGWSDGNMELDRVLPLTQDIHLTASFEILRYEITFAYADGTLIDNRLWDYGTTPTCEAPALENTAQYTFTFLGWNPEIAPAYTNTAYVALIDTVINEYLVTFYNYNDTILDSQMWQYGAVPTCVEPTKNSNEQWNYTFIGWSPQVQNVTKEAIYKALYDSILREYIVTFQWADETLIHSQLWAYGTTPSCETPVLENTAQYTFTFLGWTPEITSVTGESVYTAVIDSAINYYSVLFLDWDGTELSKEQTVAYGSAALEPALPTREGHIFSAWSKDITFITGKTYAIALYEKEPSAGIEVIYKDEVDDSELFTENITLNIPIVPYHDGYTFISWQTETNDLTEGIIIRAVYHKDNDTTPIEQSNGLSDMPRKVVRGGNVYILRGDKIYTTTGQEVK